MQKISGIERVCFSLPHERGIFPTIYNRKYTSFVGSGIIPNVCGTGKSLQESNQVIVA
jgi:hypothetical protein